MARANQRFLKPEHLARLAGMELRAATLVEGVMAGLHRSPYRGLSVEFAEYRRYLPGDEPRKIDWKAYARSDQYLIKECEDETNLDLWIVLDASASMGFTSHAVTKYQYGGMLAAAFAWLLERQKDAVGLIVLDEDLRAVMQPRSTRGHLVQVIGKLESTEPQRGTKLAEVLHRVASMIRRRSMVVLISDLLDEPTAVLEALSHLRFGNNDVTVFQTLDPAELHFDLSGAKLFTDPESKKVMPALAEDVKAQYLKALNEFIDVYRERLGQVNVGYTLLDTSEPLDRALLEFLTRHGRD